MDEVMDTKVVQMKFDNSQFKAGVAETIKQLEKLENSLELQGASDGLNNVVKASKETKKSMGEMSEAVDEIQRHFSALEVVGITVMMRLTNAAISYSSRAIQKIWNGTIGQIISGGMRRSQNIENAKFQLEGLGVAWKDISEDISYGVNETAYGLDEAARVASQLVASQVELGDEMKRSLRAISGVAAMTNSQYGEIGHIFTTVASNGKLMTMQLRELSNRGLNASAQIARYFREVRHETSATEESINNMVSKGLIDFQTFASAMDWAFGDHAKEANKTFQGAMSNVRAALSRIGAKFADPVYDNLRKVFNGLIPTINRVNAALDPVVNMFSDMVYWIGEWTQGFLTMEDTSRAMMQIAINIYSYIKPILAAFIEVFAKYIPIMDRSATSMEDFARQFALTGEKAEAFRDICKSLFSIIDMILQVGIAGFRILSSLVSGLLKVFQSLTGSMEPPLDILWSMSAAMEYLLNVATNFVKVKLDSAFEALANKLKQINWSKVLNIVSKFVVALVVAWQILLKIIGLVIEGAKRLIPILQTALVILGSFVSTAIYGLSVVGGLISNLFGRGRDLVSNIGVRFRGAESVPQIQNAGEAIATVSEESETLNESLEETAEAIDVVNERLEVTGKNARRVAREIPNIRDEVEELVKNPGTSPIGDKSNSDSQFNRLLDRVIKEASREATEEAAESIFSRTSRVEKMGFFETLASYFVGDENAAVLMVAGKIDDFLERVDHLISGEVIPTITGFVENIVDKLGGPKKLIVLTALAASVIPVFMFIYSIFNFIYGILDFIPAISRLISHAGNALFLNQLAVFMKSLSLPILALAGLMATLVAASYFLDKGRLDNIKEFLGILKDTLKDVVATIKDVAWIAALAVGIVGIVRAISDTADIFRMIRGKAPKNSIIDRVATILKWFALLVGTISVGVALLTAAIDYNPEAFNEAIIVLGRILIAVFIFTGILSRIGYDLTSSANTVEITAKGIKISSAVFANSVMGTLIGISVLIGTIIGATYLIMKLKEQNESLFNDALQTVGWIALGIGGFLASMALVLNTLMPNYWFLVNENYAKLTDGLAKSVKNVSHVVKSLGFAAIEIVGALFLLSKINMPKENEKLLKPLYIIGGVIAGISFILPIILGITNKFGSGNAASLFAASGLIASAAGALYLIAITLSKLNDVSIDPNIEETLIALTSVIMGCVTAIVTLDGIFPAGAPAIVATLAPLAGIIGIFLALGEMFQMIGYSMNAYELQELKPILITIVSVIGGVSLVIAALGAIPVTAPFLIATIAVIASMFLTLTFMFGAIALAAESIGNGARAIGVAVQRIESAIEDFINIDWEDARNRARYMRRFVRQLNTALVMINPLAIVGVLTLSYLCSKIASSINMLKDISEDAANNAITILVMFIETLSDHRKEMRKILKIAEDFAKIAWLIALGTAGLFTATLFLDATVAALAVFIALMFLYGDRIWPACEKFIDAIKKVSETLIENKDTLKDGVLYLISFSAGVAIAGALLSTGAWLFVKASYYMMQAAEDLVDNFKAFAVAFMAIGSYIGEHFTALQIASAMIIAFGQSAVIAGAMIAIVAFEFFASCLLFGAGIAAIGGGIYLGAWFLNESTVLLNEFLTNLQALEDGIEDFLENSKLGQLLSSLTAAPLLAYAEEAEDYGIEAGTNMVTGLITAIDTLKSDAVNSFRSLINDVIEGGNEEAEIHSPSKRTARTGQYLIQGLANGINDNKSTVINAVTSLVDEISEKFEGLSKNLELTAKGNVEAYSQGLRSSRINIISKGADNPNGRDRSGVGVEQNPYADRIREQNEEAAESFDQSQRASEGAQATTAAYEQGMESGLTNSESRLSSLVNRLGEIFNIDLSSHGSNTVSSFFRNFANGFGINVDSIKGQVGSLGATISAAFGGGLGKGLESIFRAVGEMTKTNFTNMQQEALELAEANNAPESVRGYMRQGMIESNRIFNEHQLASRWNDFWTQFDLPSVDDILGGLPSTPALTVPDIAPVTSNMASAISGSSGEGSGIGDLSKGTAFGFGGSTVTNNNNTYNFVQNNYSPEPLQRSAIYQQTKQQFDGFYSYVKEKNLSY